MKTDREIMALMSLYDAAVRWQVKTQLKGTTTSTRNEATSDLDRAIIHATDVLNERYIGADVTGENNGR